MITLFSCPKPFYGHTDIIQKNAIKSWTCLRPTPEIILLGIDKGIAEICQEFGLRHIAEVERNEFGTPLVNSIFEIGQTSASCSTVCYVNSDIILMGNFVRAVETVTAKMVKFLILGQRVDLDIKRPMNIESAEWEKDIRGVLARRGQLHAPNGIDFFCFPKGMYTDIPPFAIGRFAWDNWLVWQARAKGAAIVDLTDAVPVIHQNHEYNVSTIRKYGGQKNEATIHGYELRKIKLNRVWFDVGPEVQRNRALLQDGNNLNVWAATWMLDKKGKLRRRRLKFKPSYLLYQLKVIVPLYSPAFGKIVRWITEKKRVLLKSTWM